MSQQCLGAEVFEELVETMAVHNRSAPDRSAERGARNKREVVEWNRKLAEKWNQRSWKMAETWIQDDGSGIWDFSA